MKTEPVKTETKAAPLNRMVKPSTVKVRALGWIRENGTTYQPGDTFEIDTKRAKAIAANIEIIKE